MTEMVLDAKTLPEPLLRFISAKKVKVEVRGGVISLAPLEDEGEIGQCPLMGLLEEYVDYTVEKFLERKHADKELDL